MNETSQFLNQLRIHLILKNACSFMFSLCLSLCARGRYFQVFINSFNARNESFTSFLFSNLIVDSYNDILFYLLYSLSFHLHT
jgi:hypothetical protein